MHTVELLEQAIVAAQQAGFVIRQECLNGAASGACQLKGRKLLFIDLSLTAAEQLETVIGALHAAVGLETLTLPLDLRMRLNERRAA